MCGPPYYLASWYCGLAQGPCKYGRVYLSWRSRALNKTSFNIWCNWYFPMFLLRDGSLTLTKIMSLMVLVRVCDSLPTIKKLSNLVWWCEVLAWSLMWKVPWDAPLTFPQRSLQFPLYALHHIPIYHTPVYYCTFMCHVILVLRGH